MEDWAFKHHIYKANKSWAFTKRFQESGGGTDVLEMYISAISIEAMYLFICVLIFWAYILLQLILILNSLYLFS